MPVGAEILTAIEENNLIYVRAHVDTEAPNEWRRFEVAITGPIVDEQTGRRFIDNVQIRSVAFYVFELMKDHKPPTAPVSDRREGRD